MKKIIYTLLIGVIGIGAVSAQDVGGKTLISQSRTSAANIGKCDIEIKYHSPSVNSRKVFGGIVPFDFVVDGKEYPWRAGSNQRTTIDFSHPVEIEGQKLDSGNYGFVVLVSEKEWTLIFSSGKSWGAFNYDKANDVIRVPVKTMEMPFQEWLSYEFVNPQSESVDIMLRWENTAVTFNVKTYALDNIINDLSAKQDKTAGEYQSLARRLLEKDPNDREKALALVEQSKDKIQDYEQEYYQKAYTFNYKVLKSELLIDIGEKKEGKQLLEEAFSEAEGFSMYYYALWKYTVVGEEEVAIKAIEDAIKRNPENFANHLAYGEIYLKKGDQEKATEHFKKAYDLGAEYEQSVNYSRYLYLQNKLVLESMN